MELVRWSRIGHSELHTEAATLFRFLSPPGFVPEVLQGEWTWIATLGRIPWKVGEIDVSHPTAGLIGWVAFRYWMAVGFPGTKKRQGREGHGSFPRALQVLQGTADWRHFLTGLRWMCA